jgi:adenylylsulfate kinase-like enzyme
MERVIWLTGESGAGKSAVANELRNTWFPEAIVLDGDEMRNSISLDLREDFTRDGRTEHNLRVARLARELSRQTMVIVAVIAPINMVREEISNVCSPTWIYIERDLPEREGHFYEVPSGCFLVNHDKLTVEESADAIERHLRETMPVET